MNWLVLLYTVLNMFHYSFQPGECFYLDTYPEIVRRVERLDDKWYHTDVWNYYNHSWYNDHSEIMLVSRQAAKRLIKTRCPQ